MRERKTVQLTDACYMIKRLTKLCLANWKKSNKKTHTQNKQNNNNSNNSSRCASSYNRLKHKVHIYIYSVRHLSEFAPLALVCSCSQATTTGGLRIGRSEVLRNLRPYLPAQSQGHHTIARSEDSGSEKGSGRPLKGRDRVITVNQTNIGTVSNGWVSHVRFFG